MDNGVYYIAINESTVFYLVKSIKSLRAHCPKIPIAVATDCKDVMELYLGKYVDTWVNVPSVVPEDGVRERPQYPDQGYFGKVYWMSDAPYKYTLFLDHDTYIVEDPTDVFTVLKDGHFHFAAAHDVGRQSSCPHANTIPFSFMTFNTGVLALNKCTETDKLLFDWWINMKTLNDAWGDQPSFMKAVYENPSLRFLTLPHEYNFRFIYPQTTYQQVKILHGRDDTIPEIARNINKKWDTGKFWFMDKCYGYYEKGELIV